MKKHHLIPLLAIHLVIPTRLFISEIEFNYFYQNYRSVFTRLIVANLNDLYNTGYYYLEKNAEIIESLANRKTLITNTIQGTYLPNPGIK
jgi:hypothetical protein